MKFISSLILITVTFLLFSSCRREIDGSGHFVTESRSLPAFTEIESDGDFTVIVKEEAVQQVQLYGEDNILPYIITRVQGNRLRIFYNDYHRKFDDNGITIYISIPKLENVSMMGSGTISSEGTISGSSITTVLSGSGKIQMALDMLNTNTVLSGSGSIALHGISDNAQHTISGSGKIHAVDLESKNVTVNISGSGNCEVHATEHLNVHISGSGDVLYIGSPAIETFISGSGSVRPF
ncbi:MAG: head GIN domain-containing protein [Bacteroidota bacterium]